MCSGKHNLEHFNWNFYSFPLEKLVSTDQLENQKKFLKFPPWFTVKKLDSARSGKTTFLKVFYASWENLESAAIMAANFV